MFLGHCLLGVNESWLLIPMDSERTCVSMGRNNSKKVGKYLINTHA